MPKERNIKHIETQLLLYLFMAVKKLYSTVAAYIIEATRHTYVQYYASVIRGLSNTNTTSSGFRTASDVTMIRTSGSPLGQGPRMSGQVYRNVRLTIRTRSSDVGPSVS